MTPKNIHISLTLVSLGCLESQRTSPTGNEIMIKAILMH